MQSYGACSFPSGAVRWQDLQGLGTGGCNHASSTSVRCPLCSKAGKCCRHLSKALVKGEGHILTNTPPIPIAIPLGTHPGRCMGCRQHQALPTCCTRDLLSTKASTFCACNRLCIPSSCSRVLLLQALCFCLVVGVPAHPAQCLAPGWWP